MPTPRARRASGAGHDGPMVRIGSFLCVFDPIIPNSATAGAGWGRGGAACPGPRDPGPGSRIAIGSRSKPLAVWEGWARVQGRR